MKLALTLDFFAFVPDEDQEQAEIERVAAMIADGYHEGEILASDDNGLLTYRGWWRLSRES